MKQFINSIALVGFIIIFGNAQAQKIDKPCSDQIPKKVMDALKARFPKPEIDKWTREKEDGIFMYDIEFKQGGQKFEADIREDGTISNWEKAISIKDLPGVVRMTVEKKYPKANLQEAMQVTAVKDGRDVLEGYEISIKTSDKKDVEITVAPDGKILEDSPDKK